MGYFPLKETNEQNQYRLKTLDNQFKKHFLSSFFFFFLGGGSSLDRGLNGHGHINFKTPLEKPSDADKCQRTPNIQN